MRSPIVRNLLCAVLAVGTFAMILGGCSGGSSSTSPSISPPPVTTTGSPPPSLLLRPSTLTFAPGQGGTRQVSIIPPNPSYENVTIVGDTCTSRLIATAQPSPLPNPTPTPGTVPPIFNVSSGAKDGSCNFVFQDMVSMAKATLGVANNSGGKSTPTPIPTPTVTASASGNVLSWNPPSLTFAKLSPRNSTLLLNGSPDTDNDQVTGDTCSGPGIATISYFDYGLWAVTPGKTNGTCSFTVTDLTVQPNVAAQLNIKNSANAAAKPRSSIGSH